MARANTEIPAFNLAVWTTHSDNFKAKIKVFLPSDGMEAIDLELTQLKDNWENGSPNFVQFQTNCQAIFREKIPTYRTEPLEESLKKFLSILFLTTLSLIIAGLVCMLNVACMALIGLVTIAAFHFKALAIASAMIGGIAATLVTIGLFNQPLAQFHTNNFVHTVQANTAATPRPNH